MAYYVYILLDDDKNLCLSSSAPARKIHMDCALADTYREHVLLLLQDSTRKSSHFKKVKSVEQEYKE